MTPQTQTLGCGCQLTGTPGSKSPDWKRRPCRHHTASGACVHCTTNTPHPTCTHCGLADGHHATTCPAR